MNFVDGTTPLKMMQKSIVEIKKKSFSVKLNIVDMHRIKYISQFL